MSFDKQLDDFLSAARALTSALEANTVALLGGRREEQASPAAASQPEKRPPGRPRSTPAPAAAAKTEQPATAPTPGPDSQDIDDLVGDVPASAKILTYEDVREAILRLAESKGHSVAVQMLGRFGAKSGKEIKEADFAAVIDACVKAMVS
jgi:hypothetical protein